MPHKDKLIGKALRRQKPRPEPTAGNLRVQLQSIRKNLTLGEGMRQRKKKDYRDYLQEDVTDS